MKLNIKLPKYVFIYYLSRILMGGFYRSANYIFKGYFDLNKLFYNFKIKREPVETAFSRYLIKYLDLKIVDIGSNFTEFTQTAAPSKDWGFTLIDFQQNLCNFAKIELKKRKYKNFEVICGAVGKSDLNQEIIHSKGHSGAAKLVDTKDSYLKKNAKNYINFIPAKQYIKDKKIFIKADIEGSECNLLRELFVDNDFSEKINVIALELNSLNNYYQYNSLIPDDYFPFIPTPFWPGGTSTLKLLKSTLKNSIFRKILILKASEFLDNFHNKTPLIFYIKKSTIEYIQNEEVNIELKFHDLFGKV